MWARSVGDSDALGVELHHHRDDAVVVIELGAGGNAMLAGEVFPALELSAT
jgi:hypothetical protein